MKTKLTVHLDLSSVPSIVKQQVQDFARAVKIYGLMKDMETSVKICRTSRVRRTKALVNRSSK